MPLVKPYLVAQALMLILASALSTPCPAGGEIIFGGVPNIPPLSYDDQGRAKGFFTEVFLATAQRAGFPATIRLYPFKRLNKYLQTGKVDGTVAIYYTKAREAYLVYSKRPVLSSRTLVFVKKGKGFAFSSIRDLYKKKMGVVAGWHLNNTELDKAIEEGKIRADEANNYDQNLIKLMRGRLDGFIATEHVTWYHANSLGIAENLVALENQVSKIKAFFAISKYAEQISDPFKFMEKMNAAFNEIVWDGTYETILKKHGMVTPPSAKYQR